MEIQKIDHNGSIFQISKWTCWCFYTNSNHCNKHFVLVSMVATAMFEFWLIPFFKKKWLVMVVFVLLHVFPVVFAHVVLCGNEVTQLVEHGLIFYFIIISYGNKLIYLIPQFLQMFISSLACSIVVHLCSPYWVVGLSKFYILLDWAY